MKGTLKGTPTETLKGALEELKERPERNPEPHEELQNWSQDRVEELVALKAEDKLEATWNLLVLLRVP